MSPNPGFVAAVALFCLLFGIAKCARSDELIVEESAFQMVHLADTLQTLDIAATPQRWHESSNALDGGWLIGGHPSRPRVWQYMGAEAALHASITLALVHLGAPRWSLRTWEVVTIGADLSTVAHNASIGVRFHL